MLHHQYGIATPSAVAQAAHPEDSQPNERINKRKQAQPPQLRTSGAHLPPPSNMKKGYGRRGNYHKDPDPQTPWVQYAVRGNSSWRGRGRHQSRGTYRSKADTRALVHWSVEELSQKNNAMDNDDGLDRPKNVIDGNRDTDGIQLTTPAQPEVIARVDDWRRRLRSPSPKLPPQPLKRRKSSHEFVDLPQPQETSAPKPATPPPRPPIKPPLPGRSRITPLKVDATVPVKREPETPSPILSRSIVVERKLVRESCNHYPLPENCRKSNPDYRQHREALLREKVVELRRMGLKRSKAFFRDDGMVIEWTSPVPVWSDTFQPQVTDLAKAIEQAQQANDKLTPSKGRLARRRSAHEGSQASASREATLSPRKPKPKLKHWAADLGPDLEPDPIPPWELYSQPTQSKRAPPLPSQDKSVASKSTDQDVPEKEPSCDERAASERMTFKPVDPPRRYQGPESGPRSPQPTPSIKPASDLKEGTSTAVTRGTHSFPYSRANRPPLPGRKRPPNVTPTAHDTAPSGVADSGSLPLPSQPFNPIDQSPFNIGLHFSYDDPDAEHVASQLLHLGSPSHPMGAEASYDAQTIPADPTEAEALAMVFLQRYLQVFDSDRSRLEGAYPKDALFSCRVHHLHEPSFSMAGLFAPEHRSLYNMSRSCSATVEQGRRQIMDRLLTMGPYEFCPRGVPRSVQYDVALLSPEAGGGMLLTVHGEVVHANVAGPQMDHVLTVDQSFVLRPQEEDDNQGDVQRFTLDASEPPWPLVAISHQMTVRQAPLLPTEKLIELAPWIKEMLSV